MGATLRKAVDIAVQQKDHSLATRLDASCQIPRPEVNVLLDAAHPLYWQPVEQAQNLLDADERPEAVRFEKTMRGLMEADEEFAKFFSGFIDLIAGGAFLEGFVTGSIHAQHQKVTRHRTAQQRPGR